MKEQEDNYGEDINEAKLQVRKGLFVGILIHVVFIILLGVVEPFLLFFIGVVQLGYVVPALVAAKFRSASGQFMKGLALTAVAVFLLNAACFGIGVLTAGDWYNI